jgi:UDP-2,4-diacetamido-2,4,6-trideoxy-beta-L-altropyranose hydrolase
LVFNGKEGLSLDSFAVGLQVAIRADASQEIGSGHVTRCATLGSALRKIGAEVRFICRDLPGHYADWLRARGFAVVLLPAPQVSMSLSSSCSSQYKRWLEVDSMIDADQCYEVLHGVDLDWLVVDHYALDASWERAVCPPSARVLVIDDLANRTHACDLLLNQNFHPSVKVRYADLAPSAELMLGPCYALLRPEFAAGRSLIHPRSGVVRKLLVFLGGSDSANVSAVVLRTLAARGSNELIVDVIAGQSNPHIDELRALCASVGAHLHVQVNNISAYMADADLAIGAAGVATWERAALGLPTLAVSVADNQSEIASQAQELGLLRWLGEAAKVGEADWGAAIDWACANPEALRVQSTAGMQIVDGLGVSRVLESMHAHQRRLY